LNTVVFDAVDVSQHPKLNCVVNFHLSEFYVWEWEDERGKWHPYNITNSLAIEDAYKKKLTDITVVACHRSYEIELAKMEQENTVTNICRNVRRKKSGKPLFSIYRK
jgi:hypothetical protein